MKLLNIKSLEKSLPPNARRISANSHLILFACTDCQHKFPLDGRVFGTRSYKLARALGVDYLGCPRCNSSNCQLSGHHIAP